jgi:molybdopterin biosynthesis enzyme
MHYRAVSRGEVLEAELAGSVLVHDVRDARGAVCVAKGRVLNLDDVARLKAVPWQELHVAALAPDDMHEDEAGPRLACAAAGNGVRVGERSAGHWPLIAIRRGIVDISIDPLAAVNGREGLSVYTLFHGHVVDEGEVVARAKITPFAVPRELIEGATAEARATGGLVRVRSFRRARIGAVVLASLGERNNTTIGRFAESLGEKVRWLGGELLTPVVAETRRETVAAALKGELARGCEILVVAGTRAMDELDPTFLALADLGGQRVRQGVPAHPGSLFWIGRVGGMPILGLPSCGLFSEATVFDLVLPRILCGDTIGGPELASLGHGGFLTRDMAFRFPPYRRSRRRGEVAD